jgi:hypothetical protein
MGQEFTSDFCAILWLEKRPLNRRIDVSRDAYLRCFIPTENHFTRKRSLSYDHTLQLTYVHLTDSSNSPNALSNRMCYLDSHGY